MCFKLILKDTLLIVHYVIAKKKKTLKFFQMFQIETNRYCLSNASLSNYIGKHGCSLTTVMNFMLNIPCWVRNVIKIVKMCRSKRCWSPHLFPDTQLLLATSTTHYPEGWINALKHCRFRISVCMLRGWKAVRESWYICLDSVYFEMLRTVAWFSIRLDQESQFLLRILLAFLLISAWFYRTSQLFTLFVKGMKDFYIFFGQDPPTRLSSVW